MPSNILALIFTLLALVTGCVPRASALLEDRIEAQFVSVLSPTDIPD